MGNTHGRPPRPPPRRSHYTTAGPVFPPYMCSPRVDDKPVFPVMPIFADEPRKPSRRQSRNFTTGSKRRYASQARRYRSGRSEPAPSHYFPGSLDPDGSDSPSPIFSEYQNRELHFGHTSFVPSRKHHRSPRKSRARGHLDDVFFPPGLMSDAVYQPEAAHSGLPQRQRHHTPQQGYELRDSQPRPPLVQPSVSGCVTPHGGHIVPLVTCPHNMLGCMVCGRCYHDG